MAITIGMMVSEALFVLKNFPHVDRIDFDNRRWFVGGYDCFHYADRDAKISVTGYLKPLDDNFRLILESRFYVDGKSNGSIATVFLPNKDLDESLDNFTVRFIAPTVAEMANRMLSMDKGEGPESLS